MTSPEEFPVYNSNPERSPLDGQMYVVAHGRFNLAVNGTDIQDMIRVDEEGRLKERYLLAPQSALAEALYSLLDEKNIPQLKYYVRDNDLVVYQVPLHAKPLRNERLFPGRESTETYVSDKELYSNFGKLWRSVLDTTGHLPGDCLVKRTGMAEFGPQGQELFILPPYDDWQTLKRIEDAENHFRKNIEEELEAYYPSMSVRYVQDSAVEGFIGKR